MVFLERKFSKPGRYPTDFDPPLSPVLPRADWSALPESLYDVICNIQLLLKSRRGRDHLFLDYGLTPSEGRFDSDGTFERLVAELPAVLARYEPRFELSDTDEEWTEDGRRVVVVSGRLLGNPGEVRFHFGVTTRRIEHLEYVPAK